MKFMKINLKNNLYVLKIKTNMFKKKNIKILN